MILDFLVLFLSILWLDKNDIFHCFLFQADICNSNCVIEVSAPEKKLCPLEKYEFFHMTNVCWPKCVVNAVCTSGSQFLQVNI